MFDLPLEFRIAAFVALIGLIIYGVRKSGGNAQDREAKLAQSTGWLKDDDVSLEDTFVVADRHLATARSGSHVRLQYGEKGRLTLIRSVTRKKETRFCARYEFLDPDEALAAAMMGVKNAKIEKPKPEVLELWFDGDYVAFKRSVQALFEGVDPIPGKTQLTWVC